MSCLSTRGTAARILALAGMLGCGAAWARENRSGQGAVALPLRLTMEWTELFNPAAKTRLANESFAMGVGARNLKLQYSTRAPAALGGMQFQWLPAGYRLAEFGASGKWGTFGAFRSMGINRVFGQAGMPGAVEGAGVELPRALLGVRLKGSALHSSAREGVGRAGAGQGSGEGASQIDLALSREWKDGARLRMEWSRSALASRVPGEDGAIVHRIRSGDAWMVRFEGAPMRNEVAVALTDRDAGFVNAAVPSLVAGGGDLRVDIGRKVGGQRFQYSARSDWLRRPHAPGDREPRAREDTIAWSWSRAPLPRMEVSRYRSRRTASGAGEGEDGLRVSLGRAFGRLRAAGLFVRARRTDLLLRRTIWDRKALSGEFMFEMGGGGKLDVRYEAVDLMPAGSVAPLRTRILKADACVEAWGKRISLAPVMELVGQGGDRAATALRAALGIRVVPPHWFPGSDWVIRFAASRSASPGHSARTLTDLTFRWSFKR